jgi:uncharacterized YigZ family protein
VSSLENDSYLTIEAPSTGIYKDKGSKFLSFAYPVYSENEIKKHIDVLRKDYFDARHHCYAYMLGNEKSNYRAFDDGEPSGTAGKPILGQLHSYNITNVLIVVVRYFGGTLLGTSGLIQAYKSAAANAIENAAIVEKRIQHFYRVCFDYKVMNDVMKIIKDDNVNQIKHEFETTCMVEISIRKIHAENIVNKLNALDTVSTQLLMIS